MRTIATFIAQTLGSRPVAQPDTSAEDRLWRMNSRAMRARWTDDGVRRAAC